MSFFIRSKSLHTDPPCCCTHTQVRLSMRGMGGHKKYKKVFIEEVSRYPGDDWWADAALPFPHMHVLHQHLPPHEVGEFYFEVGEWPLDGRVA